MITSKEKDLKLKWELKKNPHCPINRLNDYNFLWWLALSFRELALAALSVQKVKGQLGYVSLTSHSHIYRVQSCCKHFNYHLIWIADDRKVGIFSEP